MKYPMKSPFLSISGGVMPVMPLTFRSKCHKRAALADAFAAAAAVASCCEASAGGDVMGFPWDFDGT